MKSTFLRVHFKYIYIQKEKHASCSRRVLKYSNLFARCSNSPLFETFETIPRRFTFIESTVENTESVRKYSTQFPVSYDATIKLSATSTINVHFVIHERRRIFATDTTTPCERATGPAPTKTVEQRTLPLERATAKLTGRRSQWRQVRKAGGWTEGVARLTARI